MGSQQTKPQSGFPRARGLGPEGTQEILEPQIVYPRSWNTFPQENYPRQRPVNPGQIDWSKYPLERTWQHYSPEVFVNQNENKSAEQSTDSREGIIISRYREPQNVSLLDRRGAFPNWDPVPQKRLNRPLQPISQTGSQRLSEPPAQNTRSYPAQQRTWTEQPR